MRGERWARMRFEGSWDGGGGQEKAVVGSGFGKGFQKGKTR